MYRIVFASGARKSLRKLQKSGSFPEEKFLVALELLQNGSDLPVGYSDHALQGRLEAFRECHIAKNLLLMYRCDKIEKTIVISMIGTHSELFGG